ncbi:MAG TPA: hypothetical protein VKU41_08125 [Polyangiaceae bacterium]|nr:hypothetical protein [Polyangiaceae bacterium]
MKRKSSRETERRAPSKAADVGGDRRVAKLLATLRKDPNLAPMIDDFERAKSKPGRKFGSNGLKTNGKIFALFTQGTLVIKLPKERVAELVASDVGKLFDPGHGRLMKEWLTVTSPKASWTGLAKEAFAFVNAASR